MPSIQTPCSNVSSTSTAMPTRYPRSCGATAPEGSGGSPGGVIGTPGGGGDDGGPVGGLAGGGALGASALAVTGGDPIHRPSLKTLRRGCSQTLVSIATRSDS